MTVSPILDGGAAGSDRSKVTKHYESRISIDYGKKLTPQVRKINTIQMINKMLEFNRVFILPQHR